MTVMTILETIGLYLAITGIIALVTLGSYYLLRYLAKQDAEKELHNKKQDLDQLRIKLEQKDQQMRIDAERASSQFIKRENTIFINQQQAAETLVKAQKLRDEMEQKIAQISQENAVLRNDLIAARQRAKRLANKLKTEV